jgi:Tfp pilus assembly protein PilV
MKRKKINSKASFTLLEIIISASLITIGVVSVVRFISTGVSADQSIEGKLVALNLAVQKIETLVNTTYSDISSNSAQERFKMLEDLCQHGLQLSYMMGYYIIS